MTTHSLLLIARIDGHDYNIILLDSDPLVADKAIRFLKEDTGESYDCRADQFGLHCECLGYLYHGYCKHLKVWTEINQNMRIDGPCGPAPPSEYTHMPCKTCKKHPGKIEDPFGDSWLQCPDCNGVGSKPTKMPPTINHMKESHI
jgi:hypothetical protein